MPRLALALGVLALAAPFAAAQSSTWNIDPAHSGVDFTVKHLALSNVRGHFGGLKGAISLNDSDITKSTVSVTIDTTTIDTGVQMRDNDLKGERNFDVAKFPTATFTSTSVSGGGGHLTVKGNLTLHGVTQPITLDVEGPAGPITGMDKKPHAGYSASTTLKRTDFGIGTGTPDSIVSEEIKLTIDLDVAKQ
jgi:polyisoprenoid-binding protein YceI